MKHGYFGRKLGRNKDERKRLFRNLSSALIIHGRIHTTLAKAKSIQPMVEKLITQVKRGTNGAVGEVKKTLSDNATYQTLVEMSTSRFAARTSGYTRIIKLGTRIGDAAEMVYLEFVDAAPVVAKKEKVKTAKTVLESKSKAEIQEAEVVTEEKPKQKAKTTKKSDK